MFCGVFREQQEMARIGVLAHYCTKLQPAVNKQFPMYLKTMMDAEFVSEQSVRAWCASTYSVLESILPTYNEGSAVLSEEQVVALQKSCQVFIHWLDSQEEEEEEEEEEDEEEEEEDK